MEMKVLKRTKMAEEGMDCHMRNPRNRFLTIISSGAADIVFFFRFFWFFDSGFGSGFCSSDKSVCLMLF